MRKISLILAAFLAGCATHTSPLTVSPSSSLSVDPATGAELQKAKDHVDLDKRLIADCKPLPKMQIANPTPNQVLEQKALEVSVYSDCARAHHELSALVIRYWNIPKE